MLLSRRTVVVHTILADHMSRVEAARRNEVGVRVMTMGQLAARLAGGLLQLVDLDVLRESIREELSGIEMGEFEPIKNLPGMPAALTAAFDKAWRAGVEPRRPRGACIFAGAGRQLSDPFRGRHQGADWRRRMRGMSAFLAESNRASVDVQSRATGRDHRAGQSAASPTTSLPLGYSATM
jgi:hypothetical protein